MPTVGLDILAEGGDLVRLVLRVEHGNRAVLDAYRNGALEEFLDLGGRGGGGEVEVVVGFGEQRVADRAAHAPRLVPGVLELLGDVQHFPRDLEAGREATHRAPSPRSHSGSLP